MCGQMGTGDLAEGGIEDMKNTKVSGGDTPLFDGLKVSPLPS